MCWFWAPKMAHLLLFGTKTTFPKNKKPKNRHFIISREAHFGWRKRGSSREVEFSWIFHNFSPKHNLLHLVYITSIVCIGVTIPIKKHYLLLFAKPPLKPGNCPSPPFEVIPPYTFAFHKNHIKIIFFIEPPPHNIKIFHPSPHPIF